MQTTQGTVLQSLRAVQAFLEVNADKLGGVVETGARKRLDDAIKDLTAHASDQSGSFLASQGATLKQRTLRRVLVREHMAPVARIARADLPVTPEIEPLRMPVGRPTPERLAALAYGMAKAADPHASVFVAAGLPQDFIARLTAAADAMLAAINDRTQKRGTRSGATKGIRQKLVAARKIVHVLDALVQNALKDEPALLASWNLIKRVQRVGGRQAAAPAATPSPAPAAPGPTLTPGDSPAEDTPAPGGTA
jgi:hypothetical protein